MKIYPHEISIIGNLKTYAIERIIQDDLVRYTEENFQMEAYFVNINVFRKYIKPLMKDIEVDIRTEIYEFSGQTFSVHHILQNNELKCFCVIKGILFKRNGEKVTEINFQECNDQDLKDIFTMVNKKIAIPKL